MKKTLNALLVVMAFAGLSSASWGAGVSFTFKGGFFRPSDEVFQDAYKSGAVFGIELAIPLAGGLHLWAGADYFGKTGLLPVSEEETKVEIIPLYLGLRYHFGKSAVRPYLGAAAAYFLFNEQNPLGNVSESGAGFLGQAGLLIKIGGPLAFDLHVNYRACTLRTDEPDPVEASIGGFTAGGGIVFKF